MKSPGFGKETMMARNDALSPSDKVRVLRSLAFHIHRKVPAADALAELAEQESKGGRHRMFRPVTQALEADGFVAALSVLELFGPETAAVLAPVADSSDHRLLAAALNALADYLESA
jgi:type II secretory pathway component PulF